MRVAMIGTGYMSLMSGEIPIYEPGLDDLIATNVRESFRMIRADVSKLNALTGYEPKAPLKDGLERFAKWWREYENE